MSYNSNYPDVPVDPAYKAFFETFYQTSDTPEAHEKYRDSFTKDATMIMASKECKGADEIFALRKGMWEKVAKRSHNPIEIFPFGPNSNKLMLHGTVDYVLKDDRKAHVDWAAKAVMAKEGGEVKMSFYQVYLDTAAQQNAK
ncbi:MAG: hypothetical protein M1828_004965 [Chrysothrix sp. TS-e1954]|nr:MAG: hypothetical protein M1828_004965 [Chrysothrix sp. TS-e1954]